jgi:hypothetical protein
MADWDIIIYDPARQKPVAAEGAPVFSRLPMVAVRHGAARPEVGQPVAVRENYDINYVRLLQGIDSCLEQRVDVLNLSLGPPQLLPSTQADPDPLYVATDAARQLGVPVVVAVGNHGPAQDTLQFLARPAWVIAVGATDDDRRLLDCSARGVPGGPMPAAVSRGTLHPPDPRFPKPSTSWAAPKVAVVAAWAKILLMLVGRDVQALISGQPSQLTVPVPVVGLCDTGSSEPNGQLAVATLPRTERQAAWYRTVLDRLEREQLRVQVRNDPRTVGLALSLMAAPLPQYQQFEVGAGFIWTQELLDFVVGFRPSVFALLFCDPDELARKDVQVLAGLDGELGPLWDEGQCRILEAHIKRGGLRVMARVLR